MDHAALLTDLYQLTMANGYWKEGIAEREAVFHLFFRTLPFAGGYAIACGLEPVIDWLRDFRFGDVEFAYLATLTGNDGKPLFQAGFLDYLRALKLTVDMDAIPEGTVVFAHEPLLRIRGPILQCQLLETALLCLVNFDTLVATKAARVCAAAQGDAVLEFGLRRAQGSNGAVAASRAAHVGGCDATSNVLAGMRFGIPVKGTHAHSWVMSFDDEREAFAAYARAMPNNCVFLVDTYDTIEGVRQAIAVGQDLRQGGHEMVGIRLDSGDLAWLSQEARRLLDEAGFPKAVVVASNDLDEHLIQSLKQQGAKIAVWGVGTKLVTAFDQPALGGVYKLAAIRDEKGVWKPRVKLSEQAIKVSNPGMQQVRRFRRGEHDIADVIWDELNPPTQWTVVDPLDPHRRTPIGDDAQGEDLLIPVFRGGKLVATRVTAGEARAKTLTELNRLHDGVRRLTNPHRYPVGLELGLHERKTALILAARARARL